MCMFGCLNTGFVSKSDVQGSYYMYSDFSKACTNMHQVIRANIYPIMYHTWLKLEKNRLLPCILNSTTIMFIKIASL